MRTCWLLRILLLLCLLGLALQGCGSSGGSDSPSVADNSAPVANAGTAQIVPTGSVVTLDGSSSSDVNGDLLSYSWAFTSKPAGSTAALSNAVVAKPAFTADVSGTYLLMLVVNDGKVNSVPATVTVTASSANIAPVANAGADQSVSTGSVVTLDGSASIDANGDQLTSMWAFTSKPAGSSATLSSATATKPTFTADVAGAYVLNLVVNDGNASSAAVAVTITVSDLEVDFSSLVGTYDGDYDFTVGVNGTALSITAADGSSGTCVYSATISAAGNTVGAGTYQCSNATTGDWTLSQMKVVDTADIYISILRNGTVVKHLYGMSAKAASTVSPASIGNIVTFAGRYDGISNNGPFLTDSTVITVGVTGTALSITAADFFSGACNYSAAISAAGNTVSAGTYQCSDATTGTWTLAQMKVVDTADIYISIRKDGAVTRRMYGVR